MRDRIKKPKVFLSHSKKDRNFIIQVKNDLQKCQIETWIDEDDIRDGEPWLNSIFEDGIPSCDAILFYLTQDAIDSNMVNRELNASIIQQLKDSSIRILPYINDKAIRSKLRIDISSLHCREWNQTNYNDILPSVVAEVWRSYLERSITSIVTLENAKRIELENELNQLKNSIKDDIFTAKENNEFEYIYKELNIIATIDGSAHYDIFDPVTNEKTIQNRSFALLPVLNQFIIDKGTLQRNYDFAEYVCETLNIENSYDTKTKPEIIPLLRRHGLSQIILLQEFDQKSYCEELTDKFYRFLYWLDYYKKLEKNQVL